jgi:hypothetical protein
MAFFQKQKITRIGKDVEKLEHLNIAGGNVKWCSCCGRGLAIPLKVKHRNQLTQKIPSICIDPKELKV